MCRGKIDDQVIQFTQSTSSQNWVMTLPIIGPRQITDYSSLGTKIKGHHFNAGIANYGQYGFGIERRALRHPEHLGNAVTGDIGIQNTNFKTGTPQSDCR